MKCHVRTWPSRLRVLALALALVAVPLPGLAGEPVQPAGKPVLQASVQKIAASMRLAPAQSQAGGSQADKEKLASPSFFKSKAGLAVIGVVAIGTAYAFYSASNDRIHSQAR